MGGTQGGQNPLAMMFPNSIFGRMQRAQQEQQLYDLQMKQYQRDLGRQDLSERQSATWNKEAGGVLKQFGAEPTESGGPANIQMRPGEQGPAMPPSMQPQLPDNKEKTLDLRYAMKAMKNLPEEDIPHALQILFPYMKQEDKEKIEQARINQAEIKEHDIEVNRRARLDLARDNMHRLSDQFWTNFNERVTEHADRNTIAENNQAIRVYEDAMRNEASIANANGDTTLATSIIAQLERDKKEWAGRMKRMLSPGAGEAPPPGAKPPPAGAGVPSPPGAPPPAQQGAPSGRTLTPNPNAMPPPGRPFQSNASAPVRGLKPGAPQQSQGQQQGRIPVQSLEEAQGLPSGTKITLPDGTPGTVP